jgi:hypothetical protein
VSVTAAAIIVIASSLAITYNRRLSGQKKLVKEYKSELERLNLLDVASSQFKADVERRKVKMENFEQKYDVIVRPRNTLEEVIRSLELKRKKEEHQES